MHLSTKGRYAVMAMVDLARQHALRGGDGVGSVCLAEIAARQEISLAYLEQIFARLRRKGLVTSARGPGGGYKLAHAAADTSISAIVSAVDEPLQVTRCKTAAGCLTRGERCVTHDLWDALGRQIERFLAGVSLEDVAQGRLLAKLEAAA